MTTLLLAPMEGLLDTTLRDVLTRVGGVDGCVSEFIRVTHMLLPHRVFTRFVPELRNNSRTAAGVPVRPQLLGSDPVCLAENAARLAELAPAGIDLKLWLPRQSSESAPRWAPCCCKNRSCCTALPQLYGAPCLGQLRCPPKCG